MFVSNVYDLRLKLGLRVQVSGFWVLVKEFSHHNMEAVPGTIDPNYGNLHYLELNSFTRTPIAPRP